MFFVDYAYNLMWLKESKDEWKTALESFATSKRIDAPLRYRLLNPFYRR